MSSNEISPQGAASISPSTDDHISQDGSASPPPTHTEPQSEPTKSIHEWRLLMDQAKQHAQQGEWEHALKSLHSALRLCHAHLDLPALHAYRFQVLHYLAFANRCLGRFDHAREILEPALAEMDTLPARGLPQRLGICAELGVVYRHLGVLGNARAMFEDQYETAKALGAGFEKKVCRAVGNLGMVNYQLYLETEDVSHLDLAVEQLEERVWRARGLRDVIVAAELKPDVQYANTLEAIGLARLSLCYTARGGTEQAVSAARMSLDLTRNVEDSSVVAISRFFYGRALLMGGSHDEALRQFNMQDRCTCAVAFCKEPSQEHCQYLRELADIGADFGLVDENGYTALDHAVFNDGKEAEAIVLGALRRQLSNNANTLADRRTGEGIDHLLNQLHGEARLRKGYREIFQDKIRPIILNCTDRNLHNVRLVYAQSLAADNDRHILFDPLKYVPYRRFVTLGRFPRSIDGLTQDFTPATKSTDVTFIVFFSYRWINSNPWAKTPDDAENTQYLRTIKAVEDFLQLHPQIDVHTLGIWIDVACIDQEYPMAGVAALPMVLAQCDALISLVDDNYYDRAWCSVEVMMVQALRKSYGLHYWFEHVLNREGDGGERWILREGPLDTDLVLAEKKLRFEEDRAKILFLERQCKLLC